MRLRSNASLALRRWPMGRVMTGNVSTPAPAGRYRYRVNGSAEGAGQRLGAVDSTTPIILNQPGLI